MKISQLKLKPLPVPPALRKIIGPSFIILGMGLGTGEIILWPYLVSNYGMGIIWGAVLGISFQFIINMEISRYALARGESVFVGYSRMLRRLPIWFVISTFIPWMWPGIAAVSSVIVVHLLRLSPSSTKWVTIIILLTIGMILSFSKLIYSTVERFQKAIIAIGVPSLLVISYLVSDQRTVNATLNGLVGVGEGYLFWPPTIAVATFLAAMAYSGAGGNLNLAQSLYVKEKGYGMGRYSAKLASLFTGASQSKKDVALTGARFAINRRNLDRYNRWWRVINIEHFIVFWLTGVITLILLAILAYATTYGISGASNNISFVISEAGLIAQKISPLIGTLFLVIVAATLFGTQLSIYDATSRIITENVLLLMRSDAKASSRQLSLTYYTSLWLFIVSGIIIFLLDFAQPLQLIIIAAVLNAISMFVHTGLTLLLNKTKLPRQIQPSTAHTIAMLVVFVFYGGLSMYVVVAELMKF